MVTSFVGETETAQVNLLPNSVNLDHQLPPVSSGKVFMSSRPWREKEVEIVAQSLLEQSCGQPCVIFRGNVAKQLTSQL